MKTVIIALFLAALVLPAEAKKKHKKDMGEVVSIDDL